MGELNTIDGYIAKGDYVMAGLLTRVGLRQFREDWKSWKPNPGLSPQENCASDIRVAREYCHAGRKGLELLFDIAKKTGFELDMNIAVAFLTRFEEDVQASLAGYRKPRYGFDPEASYLTDSRIPIDDGIAHFAELFLLPLAPENQKLRMLVAQAYIHEDHLDGALHVTHGTSLQAETERLVLELAEILPH